MHASLFTPHFSLPAGAIAILLAAIALLSGCKHQAPESADIDFESIWPSAMPDGRYGVKISQLPQFTGTPDPADQLIFNDTSASKTNRISTETLFSGLYIDSYQLLYAEQPRLDWALATTYGSTGTEDPRLDWDARLLSGAWTVDSLQATSLDIVTSISLPAGAIDRADIADDAIGADQLDQLGDYAANSLTATQLLSIKESSADPADPSVDRAIIWLSDGTGSGDAGDLMVKIKSGATISTFTLVDFTP